jgi:hypothetical protein
LKRKDECINWHEKYDDRFDTSSCLHFFPFHEEFKSKITSLSKSFLIGHNVMIIFLDDDYLIEYKVFNFETAHYECEYEVVMTCRVSKEELVKIMVNVFTKYPDLSIMDIECCNYNI